MGQMHSYRYDNKVQLQVSILTLSKTKVIFFFSFFFFLERVDGCYTKLVTILEENAVIVAGVAIGIAALEVRQTFYFAYLRNIGKGDTRLVVLAGCWLLGGQ